jgi:hypothetical protein
MLEERFAALANDYLAASGLPDRRVGPSQPHVDRLHDVSPNSPGLSGTPRPPTKVDFASEPANPLAYRKTAACRGFAVGGVMGWFIVGNRVRGPLEGGLRNSRPRAVQVRPRSTIHRVNAARELISSRP